MLPPKITLPALSNWDLTVSYGGGQNLLGKKVPTPPRTFVEKFFAELFFKKATSLVRSLSPINQNLKALRLFENKKSYKSKRGELYVKTIDTIGFGYTVRRVGGRQKRARRTAWRLV
jgi:hypothetical protein